MRNLEKEEIAESQIERGFPDSDLKQDEKEFESFFSEVLKKIPQRTSTIILNAYDKSKERAEKIMAKSKNKFDTIFDEFLEDVDEETAKNVIRCSCRIFNCSHYRLFTIFSMLSCWFQSINNDGSLHKIFGKSWSESLGKAYLRISRCWLGRSAVGNIVKLIRVQGPSQVQQLTRQLPVQSQNL